MAPAYSATNDADEIRRQMREVRAELRDDVHELVVSAKDMADWQSYIRAYPWLCVGGALALGYFLVPGRSVVVKPDAEGLIELAKRHKLVVKMDTEKPAAQKRGGMLGQLLGMAASMVLQQGAAVLSQQMNQAFQHAKHNGHNGHHGANSP